MVTPMPPEPADVADGGRTFKVGNTEVRISGSITIDVTAGDLKHVPRR